MAVHTLDRRRELGPRTSTRRSGAPSSSPVIERLLQLQRTAGNASVARLLAVPVQRGVGEAVDQILGVGPLDAWQAKDDATEARQSAESSGLPGFSDGPQDAYRHALWSCLMTLSIGEAQAKVVGDTHEDQVTEPDPMIELMDHHNNAMGRLLAQQAKDRSDCPPLAKAALRRGNLLIIRNWRDRSEARKRGEKPPGPGPTIASNVVPEDLETGIRPLEAGKLDVAASNERYRARREGEIIAVLKRPVRRGDWAAGRAQHDEVVAGFRDLSYWSDTYRQRISTRRADDELVTLLYARVSRYTRAEVLNALSGRPPTSKRSKRK